MRSGEAGFEAREATVYEGVRPHLDVDELVQLALESSKAILHLGPEAIERVIGVLSLLVERHIDLIETGIDRFKPLVDAVEAGINGIESGINGIEACVNGSAERLQFRRDRPDLFPQALDFPHRLVAARVYHRPPLFNIGHGATRFNTGRGSTRRNTACVQRIIRQDSALTVPVGKGEVRCRFLPGQFATAQDVRRSSAPRVATSAICHLDAAREMRRLDFGDTPVHTFMKPLVSQRLQTA